MADNVAITPGAGKTISTEDVGGVQIPRSKIVIGAAGVDGGDVATSNPFPIGVIGTVAVTQSGSWVSVGVTNANLDAALSTRASQATAAAILAALQGTLTIAGAVTASGTVAATQSGSWAVSFTAAQHTIVDSGTVTANLGTLNGAATDASVQAITAALGGTLAVAFTAGQPGSPIYSVPYDGTNTIGVLAHPIYVQGTVTANLGTIGTAATAAAQATGNASLSSLDGKVTACNTGAVVVSSLPAVTFAAPQHVIVDSATLGTVTVSGTVSATQSGTWTVVQGAAGASAWPVSLASLPALTTGSATIGAVTAPGAAALALEAGNLATIATNTGTIAGAVSAGKVLVTETSAAAAKADLDTIATNSATQATATNQTTGNTTLASILTKFTDKLALFGILGKDGSTLSSASNGVAVAPETSSTWNVSDRAARLLGALTGVNGSGIATLANPVPSQLSDGSAAVGTAGNPLLVNGATSALFDVKDRAARLLGALTGINGSGVATGANPVPVQLSDGSAVFTGAKTGQLPASLGQQTAAASLGIVIASPSSTSGATLATTGAVIKGSAATAYAVQWINTTGGAVFLQVHNLASGTPSNAAAAAYWSASLASGSSTTTTFGSNFYGGPLSTGLVLIASSTIATYTAIVSTAVQYTIIWL